MLEFFKKIPIPFLRKRPPQVAVLSFSGVISAAGRFGQGINMSGYADLIKHAFELSQLKAVALLINSPGGSPVQSNLIFKRIRALAEEKGVPVIAFADDVAASGGYMLALAGDDIYADDSSIIGSIGVISAGFGFDKAIEKLGVERRVHTAGENKSKLDPFQPEDPKDVERLETAQGVIHEKFIAMVKDRRGERLKGKEEDLFNGDFWVGKEALELGLIDGIDDVRSVMRRRFGKKVRLIPIKAEKPFWRRSGGVGVSSGWDSLPDDISGGWSRGLLNSLEVRTLWSKFGL